MHKWITVVIGAFFAMWIATGIVMAFPPSVAGPRTSSATLILDHTRATISPAVAVAGLESSTGTPLQVLDISLRQLGNATVYRIDLEGSRPVLVDASAGRRVMITDSLARVIARAGVGPGFRIERVERLERHTLVYRFGPVPVYRITFADARRTVASVSADDGGVQYTDRRNTLRRAFTSMHDFTVLRGPMSPRAVRWLLVITGFVAAAAVVTGYYLALPRRNQRQQG